MPYVGDHAIRASGRWETVRTLLEWEMVRKPRSQDIYYAVFDPLLISLPEEYVLDPFGLAYWVTRKEDPPASGALKDVSKYYATESYFENIVRDYLSRQMTAHFLFRYGQSQFASGSRSAGLQHIREASRMLYDDQGLNALIAMFFIDKGIYSEAREALKKIDLLPGKPDIKQSLWGYYYCAIGDYASAIEAYQKAIQSNPESPVHYRNLALALHRSGKTKEALHAYERSHRLSEKQGEMGSLSHGTGSD
jgi:tetratricopeptide (TPR) repeat protein